MPLLLLRVTTSLGHHVSVVVGATGVDLLSTEALTHHGIGLGVRLTHLVVVISLLLSIAGDAATASDGLSILAAGAVARAVTH